MLATQILSLCSQFTGLLGRPENRKQTTDMCAANLPRILSPLSGLKALKKDPKDTQNLPP